MKKAIKCALLLTVALSLALMQGVPAAAYSSNDAVRSITSPEKEEVVYATLDSSGNMRDVYVVNIITLGKGGGMFTDYGAYGSVSNMTLSDPISLRDDTVTVQTQAAQYYYQGIPEKAELPWIIHIRYYLDGQEMSPEALAGANGHLEIVLSAAENPDAPENFFKGCALQASLSLDTTLCTNIAAEGAAIANAGKNKQVNFTALPGKGLDARVSADVHDFKMDRISINGVGLALNMDFDTSKFTDGFDELTDGVSMLNDGAGDLNDGIGTLYRGARKLADGAKSFLDGIGEYDEGVGTLNSKMGTFTNGMFELANGATDFRDGLKKIDEQYGELMGGSEEILNGILKFSTSITGGGMGSLTDLVNGSAAINTGITGISSGISGVKGGLAQVDAATLADSNRAAAQQLAAMGDPALDGVIALLNGNAQAFDGIAAVKNGAFGGGANDVALGASALVSQYGTFDAGIQTLATQLADLGQLQLGAGQLATGYARFHNGLKQYLDGIAELTRGYDKMYDGIIELPGGAAQLQDAIAKLKDGSAELYNGADELYEGMHSFASGVKKVHEGSGELADGTQEFYDESLTMGDKINDKVDDLIAEMQGTNVPVTSFMSPKNTGIKSVQFVLATDAIKIKEKEAPPEEPEAPLTFWDRFLNLFR